MSAYFCRADGGKHAAIDGVVRRRILDLLMDVTASKHVHMFKNAKPLVGFSLTGDRNAVAASEVTSELTRF